MNLTVSGLFPARDTVLEAIEELRRAGFGTLEVFTPVPDRELLEAVKPKPSPVGFITLAGGLFGMIFGFIGASLTHIHWGLVTGGKPIVSLPPFVIVAFELTILFGGLATLAGVILLSRLPRWKMDADYDPRISEDHYLLMVKTEPERRDEAAAILRSSGAEVRP